MNTYEDFFENELKHLKEHSSDTEFQFFMGYEKSIREILNIAFRDYLLKSESHTLIPKIANILEKVFGYNPIIPIEKGEEDFEKVNIITDKYDEENKIIEKEILFESRRLPIRLYKKGKKGNPYYTDAIVWYRVIKNGKKEEEKGIYGLVQGINSSKNIKYPFVPKTFYIEIEKNGNENLDITEEGIVCSSCIITEKGKETLKEAMKYYLPLNKKDKKNIEKIIGKFE